MDFLIFRVEIALAYFNHMTFQPLLFMLVYLILSCVFIKAQKFLFNIIILIVLIVFSVIWGDSD